MAYEISELVAALFDLDDVLRPFLGELAERGVLVERLECCVMHACGVLEEAVPAAVVGWMADAPPLMFGVIAPFSPSLYRQFAKPPWCRYGAGAAVAVGCFVSFVAMACRVASGWQVTEEVSSRWICDLEQPA